MKPLLVRDVTEHLGSSECVIVRQQSDEFEYAQDDYDSLLTASTDVYGTLSYIGESDIILDCSVKAIHVNKRMNIILLI